MMRRLVLKGTANTRDLGGYPAAGGMTAWGRTYRSDAPCGLAQADVETLLAFGITTHIDLRTDDELAHRPSSLKDAPGFCYHPVDLCRQIACIPDEEAGVSDLYFEMTRQTGQMARIFAIIAEAKGGVLFHCTAGKDRTGVVAAILLMLAGVSRQDILADYMITGAYLREALMNMVKGDPDIPAFIVSARIEYMEGFLDRFLQAHASARAYLSGLGLCPAQIDSITKRLTLLT
jgi:protein-tyrosine phosphatase